MSNILVVGDTLCDKYIFGNIERPNPEAMYSLILDHEYNKTVLGGACNVAANIKSLVGLDHNVFYLGYISPDISEMLSRAKIKYIASKFVQDDDVLIKQRFVYDNHILLRLDTNKDYKSFTKTDKSEDLLYRLENNRLFDNIDLVVVSDYAKKTLSEDLIQRLFYKFHDKPFMFDVKKPINIDGLPERTIFKCNMKEWRAFEDLGFSPHGCWFIRTEGKYGYSVSANGEFVNFPAIPVGEIVDTVGCGDVFLAGMAANYIVSAKFDPEAHAAYGNKCSAVKVKKFGTALVSKEEVV